MAKIKKVIIGGTFNILHDGHKALLRRAFELGEVSIGLTSNRMAGKIRTKVRDFESRKKELSSFIIKEFSVRPNIIEIQDKFGFSLKQDFDCIVVSPDTYPTAVLINQEREKIGKKPIQIVKIDFVLDKDEEPISSAKILKK